ncbi:MAG: hypothetical protein K2I69_10230 [Muribaculaceae bacterium]|nr:hypothetical protein [Muribaculaceae bacterium]
MEIFFENIISNAAPELITLFIQADVANPPTSEELWGEIENECNDISKRYAMEQIRLRPAIDAVRRVYKALGKDPNRYRPSAEALCRRAVKGLGLYRTDTLIDLINLVSLRTGHSIGGFDANKISGDTLTLGAGREGEPYEAIGRGQLNIAGLPVYRDNIGGIGTPTSDNERTKLSPETTRIILTVNLYGNSELTHAQTEALIIDLLEKYAAAHNIIKRYYPVNNGNN